MSATFQDRYGLPLSTPSQQAVTHYMTGVDCALAHSQGSQESLQAALMHDPDFAMAHIALARGCQFEGNLPAAHASKSRALECLQGVTTRERQHVKAMATAMDGDGPAALALIREHIQDFPRDALLLKQADGPFGLIGFSGSQQRLQENLALLDSVATAYGEDWWFLSAYAFAHNELGCHNEARRLAQRSLDGNPHSGHTAHTLAHIFFETGDSQGGADFLTPWLPGFPRQGQIFSHLTWHLALFELACGHPERVQGLYAETIRPQVCPGSPLIALCDAAALLWRYDLYGLERPADSRQEIANFVRHHFPRPGITFADIHCALAYAAAQDFDALERLTTQIEARFQQGKISAGPVVVAILRGITAFARGDYQEAACTLAPMAAQVVRIGGSNAQREVVEDTLLQAYLRSGDVEPALLLLRKRLARRPSARDAQWSQQAQMVH